MDLGDPWTVIGEHDEYEGADFDDGTATRADRLLGVLVELGHVNPGRVDQDDAAGDRAVVGSAGVASATEGVECVAHQTHQPAEVQPRPAAVPMHTP